MVEAFDLLRRESALGLVGTREVAHQRDRPDLAAAVESLVRGARGRCVEAAAVHAAVDLEPDVEACVFNGAALDHLDLLLVVDYEPPSFAHGNAQLGGREHAFQHEQRRAHAGGAQRSSLVAERHCKTVDTRGERACAGDRAMPVGVGFQHRERSTTMDRANRPVVVAQRIEVDPNARRTAHVASRGCHLDRVAAR